MPEMPSLKRKHLYTITKKEGDVTMKKFYPMTGERIIALAFVFIPLTFPLNPFTVGAVGESSPSPVQITSIDSTPSRVGALSESLKKSTKKVTPEERDQLVQNFHEMRRDWCEQNGVSESQLDDWLRVESFRGSNIIDIDSTSCEEGALSDGLLYKNKDPYELYFPTWNGHNRQDNPCK